MNMDYKQTVIFHVYIASCYFSIALPMFGNIHHAGSIITKVNDIKMFCSSVQRLRTKGHCREHETAQSIAVGMIKLVSNIEENNSC